MCPNRYGFGMYKNRGMHMQIPSYVTPSYTIFDDLFCCFLLFVSLIRVSVHAS